ncbi:Hpt domain-containing protein [Fertoebacter nigrum]|uniref:Hpt domain-containing protein n=1 Tax=Fertoeibacter niger TaxID=2656921 RepID=A0A8X8KPF1_9RHOB|nr:Hpt domain-containing protein [Fertoeibacter niger]NUB44826.1 Hpt domain-containing protein [Fertoeibacter niger]
MKTGLPQNAPAPGANPAYLAALEPVRRRFIETTEARILEIEALRLDVEAGRDAEAAARQIARIAHKISGVAATLGFAQVGALAAQVERLLDAGHSGGTAKDRWARAKPQVESLLDALEAVLDA